MNRGFEQAIQRRGKNSSRRGEKVFILEEFG